MKKLTLTKYRDEIVPVYTTDKGNKVVDGRELYASLELKKDYSDWVKSAIKRHKFKKDIDYVVLKPEEIFRESILPLKGENSKKGRRANEYVFLLNPAKKIAMGTNNKMGDRIKDYFLECERIVRNSILNQELTIADHAKPEIQIENSKASGAMVFQQGGLEDTKEYYKKTCEIASGLTTTQVKKKGKEQGLKSKDCKSARAALRKIDPSAAATISFIDTAYRSGVSLDKVKSLANKVKDVFTGMIELGLTPKELKQ